MNKNKEKILIAMSGGVDSSVAAALLCKQGYQVTGAFMINYDEGDGKCWQTDYKDALRVAAKLGIQLLKLNFTTEYQQLVLDYMFTEYKKGRTPNPDVLCNKFIKFGVWLDKARQLGFTKLATGHYAKVKKTSINKYKLLQAKDKKKDQTYFLHQLNQKQLSQVLFPLGKYKKKQVRDLAKKFALPTADKAESMGICFVGKVPMKQFLQKKIKLTPGNIILAKNKKVIGQHQGLAFYTIGQRHIGITNNNIDINRNKSLYVADKNFKNNQLIVAYKDETLLNKKEVLVIDIHWISGQKPKFPLKCKARLRHQQALQACQLLPFMQGLLAKFSKPQFAVTPGQFMVFYLKDLCLGGGVIK